MDMWIQYLRLRKSVLGLSLLLAGVCIVTFCLYRLPAEAVGYAFLLWGVPALLWMAWDCGRFYRKHRRLLEITSYADVTLENLPEPSDLLEEDYQQVIRQLFWSKGRMESELSMKYRDMMDYYTMWAHQIKTPIAAMRLLLQSEPYPGSEELLEQLFHTEQYVEVVLQYMRTESGGKDLVIRQYPLEPIVRQAVRKYAKSFIRKKIRLEFSELNCTVVTDEKWLTFVVEQILSNALKYTKKGSISIYMDPDRSRTMIIEDTGIGIAPEDLPRIFEKGFTGYNGRSSKKSTGIGLYLCKSVMDRLSHTISIESEVGKGTKVRLGLEHVPIQVE